MNYQVTACLIKQNKNYFEAEQYCHEIGMNLYSFARDEAKENLYIHALEIFGVGSATKDSVLYVKGYYSFGCQRISNKYGDFTDILVDCNTRSWVYCEYKKPPRKFFYEDFLELLMFF
jgi:hypothetical protein